MNKETKKAISKLKRQLSTSKNELASIQAVARSADSDSTNKGKINKFKAMITSLERYYVTYEDAYNELVVLDEEIEELSFPTEEDKKDRNSMRSAYYEIKTIHVSLTDSQPPVGNSNVSSLQDSSTIFHDSFSSHLPEIKLEKFDGEILNWPKFRDAFTSIVDQDKRLSSIKKFHYLRTSVTGPALTMISKFQITDANYTLAWKALCEAYDKRRLLATAYLNRILNFSPIQGKPSIESFKSFMTHVSDSISAFELLKIPSESNFILFHLAYRLLDQTSKEQFQFAHKDTEFPTFEQLFTFIRDKCFSMQLSANTNLTFENFPTTSRVNQTPHKDKFDDRRRSVKPSGKALVANQPKFSQNKLPDSHTRKLCFVCNESSHGLISCKKFCGAEVRQRISWLINWKGCRNCLSSNHESEACQSKWVCRWCKQRHNSLICDNDKKSNDSATTNEKPGACCAILGTYKATDESQHSQVILGTAVAEVLDGRGTYQKVRLVVDSASHYSFITSKCANRLGLVPKMCDLTISGIGNGQERVKGSINCVIKPVNKSAPQLSMKALLMRTITSHLPTVSLPRKLWIQYTKFNLADPKFYESKSIDILLGADIFSEIWLGRSIEIDYYSPKLFPTVFGHVVIGKFTPSSGPSSQNTHGTSLIATNQITINDLNVNLRRFWEIEEPKPIKVTHPDDIYCESHFNQTYFRLEDGSYGVRLPFRNDPPEFPDIATVALKRFRHQENRLLKNDELREKYHEFMKEYEQLGHMSISSNPPAYVIPHHHVSKIDRNECKIRVVFDGSAQSQNGSLNEYLFVGPKLQTDIRDVLLNFRVHKVALVSDCVKMFRGIWIHPDDRKYQTIYWRFNPQEALQNYELNTLVYGLTSSPYLANRIVRKIVEDHGSGYPEASEVLLRDIYVDDIVSGSKTIEEALNLQNQLINLLGKGKLKLSKWASNEPELLKNVSEFSDQPVDIISRDDTSVKILGLQWNPKTDCFGYKLDISKIEPTKRTILSNVSKIYDPLGFISPLVITMKKFMQDLWKLGLEWDQPIPNTLKMDWEFVVNELHIISNLKISRFLQTSNEGSVYQIIGFSDASEIAYCAALYLRVISSDGINTTLLTAKTKLAPLKTLTIPRLELCGCFLLARLYQSISDFINLLGTTNLISPCFFTDSTIALGWLQTPTYNLKTFVCNRVSDILQVTSKEQWHHVSSSDNPADSGSRGLSPQQLLNCKLWWNGPSWLSQPDHEWNLKSPNLQLQLPEVKEDKTALISVGTESSFDSGFIVQIIAKFSSFYRLLRTLAHVIRFIENLKLSINERKKGPLKLHEIRSAQAMCVKATQRQDIFKNDFSERGQEVVLKKFIKLNPFFDAAGILRAGGRLYNSNLPYNHKHPVILPSESHLSTLIVDHFHKIYQHPGPSLLHAVVQSEFWIPTLRRLAQKRVFSCNRCYRLKGKTFIPKMADLPSQRVQAARAFLKTGLDFAGPLWMKDSLRRKSSMSKVYICIFVCMATKAIHIEAVTSLSADGFLAALDRFVSLRGLPSDIYSDCGSNFVAAARKLKEWYCWYCNEESQKEIEEKLTVRQINWHFNPPHAPHFGGIWEAGVKSVKSLLIRTVGDVVLTYEELATLIAKISAVLNSRPISPLSNDPMECEYLSPGHFLVGEAPIAIPEPTLLDVAINRLDRWQLVKRMSQHFWERWHKEYLSTLQNRNKWTEDQNNLKIGDLVFLKDENQPILQWSRGRIVGVHPGKDGIVRAATVQTATSTFNRPVAKLVPLFPPKNSS